MEFTLNKSFTAIAKSRKKIEAKIDECVEFQPEAWAEELGEEFKTDPSNAQPVEYVFHTITPISHQVLPIAGKDKVRYLVTAVVQVTFEFEFEGGLEGLDEALLEDLAETEEELEEELAAEVEAENAEAEGSKD